MNKPMMTKTAIDARPTLRSPISTASACIALVLACLLTVPALGQTQKVFKTPKEAVVALQAAVKAENVEELMAIFGPEGKELLSSGDPVADKHGREVILAAMDQAWSLTKRGPKTQELVIGHEDWPFPVPLVKEKNGWRFDTAAGKEEALARRVGRNELSIIRACHAYVAAQREYARKSRDGKPTGLFAQQIVSDTGMHNGLYWPAGPDEEISPMGELAAEAAQEGYQRAEGKPRPFHGYFSRVLKAQGNSAPGGAKSYIVDGEMSAGFALVAWPAEYGNSGVMTFIVNHDGVVYEKDLGPETAKLATEIKEYDPDNTWQPVQ